MKANSPGFTYHRPSARQSLQMLNASGSYLHRILHVKNFGGSGLQHP